MVCYPTQPILNRSTTKPKTKIIAELLSTIVLKQINKVFVLYFPHPIRSLSFSFINSYLFNIAFVIIEAACPSAQQLYLNDAQTHICDKLLENSWSGIKCTSFRARNVQKVDRCSKWWGRFASCFNENETAHWVWQCSAMFCQSSPLQKAAADATVEAFMPVKYTLHVHPCRPFRKNVFAVNASGK